MIPKKLIAAREHLDIWLERSQHIADLAPVVKRNRDLIDWDIRALESLSADECVVPTSDLESRSEAIFDHITKSLPPLPEATLSSTMSANALTTSSTSIIVTQIQAIAVSGTPEAMQHSSELLNEYRQMQESHNKPAQIDSLLQGLLPPLAPKFELARKAYERWRAGLGETAAAAIEMRTFLDSLKTELQDLARRRTKRTVSLERAVDCLFADPTVRTAVRDQLVVQRSSLVDELSRVAKRKNIVTSSSLDALWARVLDHAFIVLTGLMQEP